MYITFRQGIIGYQTSPQPFYINSSGNVSIDVSTYPITINFSQGAANYLYTENSSITNAWIGAFDATQNYWLYWDIDTVTAERTFGYTQYQPLFGSTYPINPSIDQHYFYIPYMKQYYWNGQAWIECIRVFAGLITAGVFQINSIGSQISVNIPSNCGQILFDVYENPLIKYTDIGIEFLTSIDVVPPAGNNLSSIKFKQLDISGVTNNYIPKYYCVASGGEDNFGNVMIVKASYFNLDAPAFALTSDNMQPGDVKQLITGGFIYDPSWSWEESPFTPIFVGADGNLTTYIDNFYSIQKIGYIVNTNTIFLDFEKQIILSMSDSAYLSPTPSMTPSSTPPLSLTPTPSVTPS